MQRTLFILFWFISSLILFSKPQYTAFNAEVVSELAHSRSRVVFSLAGSWERALGESDQQPAEVFVPCSDTFLGKITYKKTFRMRKDFIDSKHISIYFPGIAGDCKLYINNDFVVKLNGINVPTMVPITGSRLVDGTNELTLEFEPTLNISKLQNLSLITNPQVNRGILREPLIVGTSRIFVNELNCNNQINDRVSATLKVVATDVNGLSAPRLDTTGATISNKSRITVEYGLRNKTTLQSVTAPATKDLLVENARTTTLNFDLATNNLSFWTPETPNLYELYVKLYQNGAIIDEYFINIGRRTVNGNENNIVLNGNPVEIKAITYYEHHGNYNSTLPHSMLESDIKKFKLLGANAIRFRFMPPHPYLMALCDKYGLLVLIDLPLNNINSYLLTNQEFISQSRNMLSQLLASYQSHSAFIGIGLGDCVEEKAGYNYFMNELLKHAKQYNALKYKVIEAGTMPRDVSSLDFLICKTNSVYNTNDELTDYIDTLRKSLSSLKPIILNCFTNVLPGNLNGYSDKFSTSYQAYFFQNCYNLSKQQKLGGILINSFNDYRTNYPILALDYWDQYLSTDGITNLYRQDKPSVLMLKNLFLNDKLPLLNRGDFEQIQTTSYIVIGLLAVLILVLILNRYNRFREYFFRAFLRSYNFFSDIRDRRIKPMYQTTILGILTSFGVALCLSNLLFSMRFDINYSFLLSSVMPFPDILTFLFKVIYMPELLLLVNTLLFIVLSLLLTLIISFMSLFLRRNLSFKQCFGIVVWISIPSLILLPIGIILSKLFLIAGSIIIAILAVIYALLIINWFYRFFKALAIIFDWTTFKVYCFGFIFIIAIIIMPVVYYENQLIIVPYVKYFFSMP